MKENFHLRLVQFDIEWEQPQKNYDALDGLLVGLESPIDLVVLPEMFTTGFSMSPERIAEPMAYDMPTLTWMRKWAKALDACIAGSVSVAESGRYYNRLFWVFPDGEYRAYDKRHTFTFAGEDKVYTRGHEPLVVEWRGWHIKPLICYDLRFPVWSKNRMIDDRAAYDLLLYVANWPGARRDPWNKLLPARAIENQSYVAAVNRVGLDGNGNAYVGDSVVIDPRGIALAHHESDSALVLSTTLDAALLRDFRTKFPALSDDDDSI